jgi:hypothetical protein
MVLKDTADTAIPDLAPLQRKLLGAGAAGAVLSLAGLFTNPARFFESYLIAYMWCLGISLGCLAFGMVHQLSGGAWGVVVRRPIGAATRLLPVLTVLFLPIVFGMGHLYIWTHADVVAHDEILQHKQIYLNTTFFLVRAAFYFLVWNGLSYVLNALSREQDRTGDPAIARKMQLVSAGGLIAYGITITFASFDWLMSIEPHWFSTIYGMLVLGGQGLSALAFLICAITWLGRRAPLDRIVVPAHLHDLGNLMLAFVMLWAYFSFSQYLIIWAGNLPPEISWYMHRLQTSWRFVGLGLVVFHFAVPFLLLLQRAIKRSGESLFKVAILVLIVRLVDLWWLTAPDFDRRGIDFSWMDVCLPLSMGAIWLGCVVWQLRQRPILPFHDPQFDDALGRIIQRGGTQPKAAH